MHIGGYWWESHKERDHWEDQDECGWIILKWILDRLGYVDWTSLAHDRNQRRALVNMSMDLRVP
jgi:hypothetical protein